MLKGLHYISKGLETLIGFTYPILE